MVVDDPLFDGDGNFLFHLAAHFRGHKLGGVKVDGLVDGSQNAVFHQALDDFAGGFLHPGSQFANGDLLWNLHGDGSLPGNLHLQAAHLLLLFVTGLVALELTLLLLVLLLALAAANALLAALVVLHPLGNQVIHIGKPVGIDLDGRGVHHPALPLALRLLGSFGLGGLLGRLGVLGLLGTILALLGLLGLLGTLGRCGLSFLLGFFFGCGRLHCKNFLHGFDLILLGHVIKHHIQLFFAEDLGVGLGLLEKLSHNLRDYLRGHTEIRGDLLDAILNKTHSIHAPPKCDSRLEMQSAKGKMRFYPPLCILHSALSVSDRLLLVVITTYFFFPLRLLRRWALASRRRCFTFWVLAVSTSKASAQRSG